MAYTDMIDSLIATYRNLNLAIRPMPDSALDQAAQGGGSLRDVLVELRNHELQTSQMLKQLTLAEHLTGVSAAEASMITDAPESPRLILSDFGTAREAILAQVREMSEEDWETERDGPNGKVSVRGVIERLVEHDRKVMQQIEPLLGARRA